ncbi:MAG TPA: TonB-dependent receptor [Allosphingosinicella sp.]|nr:TonB-dependent receptor [Allosphingosinicella sp.]
MRLRTLILSSTSAAVLAISGSPAAAQDEPAAPVDPTVEAQTSPNDPEQGSPQTDDAVQGVSGADDAADDETIVVTGLRRSLQSARNIKRNSEQVVDAIVAEDIGKLPDVTVSDTAARIPGIQVERRGGEASNVLLRGLDEDFYTTTYNGREIFTAETRSVALQDFPAGAIAALEAFKTSTAELVEPGLAGLINVRSRRPFDFDGFEIAGSLWANYPEESDDPEPNANLLITNRWDAGDGEIGALINFSYTRMHFQDSIRRHGFFIAGLAGGRSPDWPEIQYNEAERWRPSINAALQWRPSPGLEFYVEGLWQGYREHVMDRMFAQPLWGGGDRYTDIVMDGDRVVSGVVDRPGGPFEAWGFQGATKRWTNTYQFAVGGSYDAGPLRISGDIARTDTQFDLRTESIDYEVNNNNYAVEWFTGRPGGEGPTFRLIGFDPTDITNYNYRGFYEDHLTAKGDDWQARLDLRYESGLDWLPKVDFGVRFVNRDASAERGDFYWNLTARGGGPGNYCCGSMLGTNQPIPITAVPLEYELFSPGFSGDDLAPFPRTWFAPTFDSVWDNLQALRQFNIDITGAGSIGGPAVNPARTFNINEKSYAAYGQLSYDFTFGGTEINGVLGLRAVRTKENIEGTRVLTTGPEPVDFRNSYWDWLPNFNMNVRFSPEWVLRLAATQTRTRPTFQQLNPALVLNAPPGCTPGASDCVRTGSGGNPFLEPLESNNYDLSLEYYFSRTGFASAALFRRDMRGFIRNRAFQFPEPDPETGLPLIITGPVNTNKGRIQGAEFQVSTFLDFEALPTWARSFGVQANATYIDAKADFELFADDDPFHTTRSLRIPDVSKWTYNLIGMYENGGFTARLAYNLRTGYPEGALSERIEAFHLPPEERPHYTLQGRARSRGRLDWSSSYAFNDNFTVFLDWLNILKNPFKSDIVRVNYGPGGAVTGTEEFPMVYRIDERIVSGGIRFRF